MKEEQKEEQLDNSLLTVEELTASVHGIVVGFAENYKNFSFTSVTTDSRKVVAGSLFVPLIGEFQDGHKYIGQAIKQGATVIFVTRSVYNVSFHDYMMMASENPNVLFIIVENNLYALQDAARTYVRKFPNLVKIAVTGSSGKTTTKEILASILREKYNLIATVGNFNSETGLPLSVFNIRKEHEAGLFEMGMNRENEIAEIASVFKPQNAIITNIGTAHIGLLGSRENIAKEKKNIFNYIQEDGFAVIPEKDDFANFLCEGVKGKIVFYGKDIPEEKSGVRFVEGLGVEGTKFTIDGIETVLKIPGSYNYLNCLGCIAMARSLGLSSKQISDGINKIKAPEGRSKVKNVITKTQKKITVLEDCYNANPDSMASALEMCGDLKVEGKKIYILGDMFELGEEAEVCHSKIGALAVLAKPNKIFFIGTQMGNAVNATKLSGYNYISYYQNLGVENLEKICSELLDYISDGDFIFVKASHGMHLEKILEEITERVVE